MDDSPDEREVISLDSNSDSDGFRAANDLTYIRTNALWYKLKKFTKYSSDTSTFHFPTLGYFISFNLVIDLFRSVKKRVLIF